MCMYIWQKEGQWGLYSGRREMGCWMRVPPSSQGCCWLPHGFNGELKMRCLSFPMTEILKHFYQQSFEGARILWETCQFASVTCSDFAEQWIHVKIKLFASLISKHPTGGGKYWDQSSVHWHKEWFVQSCATSQQLWNPLLNPLGLILICPEAHLWAKNRCWCV